MCSWPPGRSFRLSQGRASIVRSALGSRPQNHGEAADRHERWCARLPERDTRGPQTRAVIRDDLLDVSAGSTAQAVQACNGGEIVVAGDATPIDAKDPQLRIIASRAAQDNFPRATLNRGNPTYSAVRAPTLWIQTASLSQLLVVLRHQTPIHQRAVAPQRRGGRRLGERTSRHHCRTVSATCSVGSLRASVAAAP